MLVKAVGPRGVAAVKASRVTVQPRAARWATRCWRTPALPGLPGVRGTSRGASRACTGEGRALGTDYGMVWYGMYCMV